MSKTMKYNGNLITKLLFLASDENALTTFLPFCIRPTILLMKFQWVADKKKKKKEMLETAGLKYKFERRNIFQCLRC